MSAGRDRTKARAALDRLREGNRRFASNTRRLDTLLSHVRRADLLGGQRPFAIILGCSDSRVPAELVFDQGLGDLFVIRVAGNIVAPSQIGSVEFAAAEFGTRLVVVLGHSQCGAIHATLEELRRPAAAQSRNLMSIVNRIRPSVETLLATDLRDDTPALVREAVRANVRASVHQLRHGSAILEGLIDREGLVVAGAEYSLETGVVDFLDESACFEMGRETIDSSAAADLIRALDAELSALYPEEGTPLHFRLDPGEVSPGRGAFLVARDGGTAVACGAVRRLDARTAEIKRMFVAPAARGCGLGRRLLAALEAEAQALGAARIVLETGPRQPAAITLYASAGYTETGAFGEYAPSPSSIFMEKEL